MFQSLAAATTRHLAERFMKLHTVSNSWATSPANRFLSLQQLRGSLILGQFNYSKTWWFIIQVLEGPAFPRQRKLHMAFRVRNDSSTPHVLSVRPKGSERRHLLSGTLVKSGQLPHVIKGPFRKHTHRSTNIKATAALHVLSITVRFVL